MKRINIGFWFEMGAAVRPLKSVSDHVTEFDLYISRITAGPYLNAALDSQLVPMSMCSPAGRKLLKALEEAGDAFLKSEKPPGSPADTSHIAAIRAAAAEFETVFLAELLQADAYYVSAKGTYSTFKLIANADTSFVDDEVRHLIPDKAKKEIREWGRCFAFELATASGFHIMRATEIVILDYLRRVTGKPKLRVAPRTWSAYIKALEKAGANERITSALDQIRKLHRNPLMHPEDVLSMGKADALFGVAKAAIIAMVTPDEPETDDES